MGIEEISPKEFTILIVDDERELVEILDFRLKRDGFSTLKAFGGDEAFELLKNHSVHFVITDIRMPNGDGVSLLKKIKTAYPKIPAVGLLTGFSDASESELKELGAEFFLKNPLATPIFRNFW